MMKQMNLILMMLLVTSIMFLSASDVLAGRAYGELVAVQSTAPGIDPPDDLNHQELGRKPPQVASINQGAASEGLVLWNKLGSDYEVLHSEVGEDGTVVGHAYAYEAAKYGNGYVRKATGENYVEFPASVIHNLSYSGTIELWITPKVPHPVPYLYGFFALVGQPVSGPTVPNNRGNVYLYWGDGVTGQGLYGGVRFDGALAETPSESTQFFATVGEPFHVAIVWDIDGIDGTNDRVRVYRNGGVVGSTTSYWNPDGTLLEDGFRIGQGPDGQGFDKFIADNIKVWDYAKTDFSDRFVEGGLYARCYLPLVLRFDDNP